MIRWQLTAKDLPESNASLELYIFQQQRLIMYVFTLLNNLASSTALCYTSKSGAR